MTTTDAGEPHAEDGAVRFARWAAAAIAVLYGSAKLTGAQFTVLDSELDRPMGAVSGFWLVWHFFGYSAVYGTAIALTQVAAGVLLTFRRTAVLGALVLLPIAVNIVLVDLCYGVDLGGTGAAVVLLLLVVVVLAPHARRLFDAALDGAPASGRAAAGWAARTLIVGGSLGGTWWVANVNNRAPTAIDGAWVPTDAPAPDTARVTAAFFERNRASMLVLRTADGRYAQHHFELAPDGTVRVWRRWLSRGDLLYQGRRSARGDTVTLAPVGGGAPLVLRRRPPLAR